ncbi:hypothetical protein [Neobacillus cucumis]|uniref:Uncharacterized protein n=1 Tax=Neobacillus cucumis TaxID=1740721 RepID=A0A2N5HFI2_9BACI|nr:hypothetical protein [Neobacillus cucumis]PLS04286.1 hypothetical protein CVD27_12355 [Neobacillus cucumis]
MHIRHAILMGVFLGAAAFWPNNAWAEKPGAVGQSESQNPAVPTTVLEKAENPSASKRAVPVTPEKVNNSQSRVVQKPVTTSNTKQTLPKKPAPKSPNTTNRSMKRVVPTVEKNIQAVKSTEPAARVKDTGQTSQTVQAKPKAVANKLPEAPKSVSSNQSNSKAKTNSQPPSLHTRSETIQKVTEPSLSKKTSSSLNLIHKPLIAEEKKTPTKNRRNSGPADIEILNPPSQRTQSSGGPSNEQLSSGTGTISFTANLFDRDEYFGLNLSQIYTSRQAKYCHQWSNAPPSPPPKGAPFFLTFTAYLATCNDN